MFLFGSGADSCYSDKLKAGKDFNEALLTNKYENIRKNILGESFHKAQFIHPNSKKIFAQTIFYHQKEARGIFGNEIVELCISYYEESKRPEDKEKIDKLDDFFKKSYKSISDSSLVDCKELLEYREFYIKNAQFFDTLDEKFNALRFPEKLNINAKRVINAYWIIFLLMIDWIYGSVNNITCFSDVINLLKKESNIKTRKKNYYSILRSRKNYEIATTNYTPFVSQETNTEVLYLHGNLKWFENLEELTIYEIDKDNELLMNANMKVIPFLLIPSGVKPMICSRQIREFGKFIAQLESCDELCVMGYRFNSEDNHINSIISEWLCKNNHHMTVFDYGNDIELENLFWINDNLKLNTISKLENISFDSFKNTKITKIIKDTKDTNCKNIEFVDVFERYVNFFTNKR